MLSIDSIVRVVLNLSTSAASPSAFDTGLILTQDGSYAADRRLQTYLSAAAAAAGLSELGFAASSPVYQAAMKYFAATPTPARLLVSCYPAAETLSDALDAVLEQTAAFYGVFPAGVTEQDALLAFADHVSALEKPCVLFLPATGTPAAAVAEDGLLASLFARATRRALTTYVASAPDAAAVLGTAMGLQLSHPSSAFALCYKTVSGLIPSALTESQISAIKALNGNVYVTRGYTHHLLEQGAVASGERYDSVLYLDMISDALQTAAVSLLAENTDRLPQTDDTSAQFVNRFSAILSSWAARGVLATGPWRGGNVGSLNNGDVVEGGFTLWAESYDVQSDADRAAHRAMPINVALVLAGSVESVVIAINVAL